MKSHNIKLLTQATALCCLVACAGDFVVTFLLGFLYPDYHFLTQSQSYLGTNDSPVASYMTLWGICFSGLFIAFAFGLRKTVFASGYWQSVAVWLIIIYALGEGLGSGLFPYDHSGGELTSSAKLHGVFSGMGDTAMVLLPFVLLKIFPRRNYPRIHVYALVVGISGPALIIIFLLATKNIVPFKGLWQRLFILDYYSLLAVIAINMMRSVRSAK